MRDKPRKYIVLELIDRQFKARIYQRQGAPRRFYGTVVLLESGKELAFISPANSPLALQTINRILRDALPEEEFRKIK